MWAQPYAVGVAMRSCHARNRLCVSHQRAFARSRSSSSRSALRLMISCALPPALSHSRTRIQTNRGERRPLRRGARERARVDLAAATIGCRLTWVLIIDGRGRLAIYRRACPPAMSSWSSSATRSGPAAHHAALARLNRRCPCRDSPRRTTHPGGGVNPHVDRPVVSDACGTRDPSLGAAWEWIGSSLARGASATTG